MNIFIKHSAKLSKTFVILLYIIFLMIGSIILLKVNNSNGKYQNYEKFINEINSNLKSFRIINKKLKSKLEKRKDLLSKINDYKLKLECYKLSKTTNKLYGNENINSYYSDFNKINININFVLYNNFYLKSNKNNIYFNFNNKATKDYATNILITKDTEFENKNKICTLVFGYIK